MLILTNSLSAVQPDYVALGMILVLLLVVAVMAIRKAVLLKKHTPAADTAAPPEPMQNTAAAPGTAGELKLHDVEPKTAAMLMAIVADKLGKPLNELRFLSIKEVK